MQSMSHHRKYSNNEPHAPIVKQDRLSNKILKHDATTKDRQSISPSGAAYHRPPLS